jgi:hypothetical protein
LVVGVGGQQALVIGGLGSLAVGALGLMVLAFVQANAGAAPVVHIEDADAEVASEPPQHADAPDEPRQAPA